MRNTLSMVALGIGLLSPGCKQKAGAPAAFSTAEPATVPMAAPAVRTDEPATGRMADRVEAIEAPSAGLAAAGSGAGAADAVAGTAAATDPAPASAAPAPAARDDARPMPPAAPPPASAAALRSATGARAGAGAGGAAMAGDGVVAAAPAHAAKMARGAAVARETMVAPEPAPAPVANVRAGEWDDNANYRDYVRWLQQTPRGIARLDVSNRQFLVVEDAAGKPVPNCQIMISGGQSTASLVTTASGRALLFPRAMGLHGGTLEATATCGGAMTKGTILAEQADGVTELRIATERVLPARRTVDLAFVLDTTGSMSEEIEAVKSTIRAVAAKLGADQTDVRIGLVEYKDRGDAEVTHAYPFSSDLAAFSRSVARITAGGGGDYPEDMQAGLSLALDQLQWRPDATARMIVVIGDAPPHLDYQDERDYADAARRAAARGIKMYTVAASGMDLTGQIVMRQMAQFTGANNLFVLRGGAGPQSVGGGDPQSSCGGTQGQYASGNLDQLILAKVKRELAALDGDPLRIAGRGQDENAKPCNQRIVIAN
jgi:Mg-chelatase subunit ChlD